MLQDVLNSGHVEEGIPWSPWGVRMEAILRLIGSDVAIITMRHQCGEDVTVVDTETILAVFDHLFENKDPTVRFVIGLRPRVKGRGVM